MPLVPISDFRDPRVADYLAVSEPDMIRSRGVFLAEGRLVVQRLVEDRRCRIHSLLLNPSSHRALGLVLAGLPAETPIYLAAANHFQGITGVDIHRGCLALAERPPEVPLKELLSSAHMVVILEGVGNVDNVGGVFRNAAAFGVDAVLLNRACADPLYRKAIRTSMAATFRVPFVRLADWPHVLGDIRRGGFMLVALTPRVPSVTLDAFALGVRPRRVALLVGAEGPGLSESALALADHRVRIPIVSSVDSLNVAVATGIVLARLSGGAPL